MPLWDFASAARALPGQGLADSYHPSWGRTYFDHGPLYAGWQVRNLTALQSLDVVWRGVKYGAPQKTRRHNLPAGFFCPGV